MNLKLCVVLLLSSVAVPALAHAQTPAVKNPSGLEFTSADHAIVTSYELDIVRESDKVVVQTLTVANSPVIALVAGKVVIPLNVQPVTFGSYRIVSRAVAGALKSVDSVPSDVFERVPGAPSKGVLK